MNVRSCEPRAGNRKQHWRRGIVITGGLVAVIVAIPGRGGADVATAPLVRASTSMSAFPGRNGKIAVTTRKIEGCCRSQRRYILLVNPDGSEPNYLTQGYAPAWSPNGRKLLFVSPADSNLWVVRADGSARRRLGSSVWDGHDWSPDGRRIVAAAVDGLTVMRADGSHRRPISLGGSGKFAFQDPRWSPDGAHIAFDRYSFAEDRHRIVVIRLADQSARVVSDPAALVSQHAAWSPDGAQLAYIKDVANDGQAVNCRTLTFVAIVDVRQLQERVVHEVRGCPTRSDVAWSPDGTKLAVVDVDWVRTMDVNGRNTRRLVRSLETPYASALSWQAIPRP